jgi:hypothetical protein
VILILFPSESHSTELPAVCTRTICFGLKSYKSSFMDQ